MDMNHFKLQFITHFTDTYSYLDSARMALEGGCRWVQLRMKHASDEETEAVAVEVQKLCRTYGATFLIDDRVELVRKLKADGVHLGKNDMPIAEALKNLTFSLKQRLNLSFYHHGHITRFYVRTILNEYFHLHFRVKTMKYFFGHFNTSQDTFFLYQKF